MSEVSIEQFRKEWKNFSKSDKNGLFTEAILNTCKRILDTISIYVIASFKPGGVINKRKGYKVNWGIPTDSNHLTIRTSRLARSFQNQAVFGRGLGGAREGIKNIYLSNGKITGAIGSRVPYASIHEYGGSIPERTLRAYSYTRQQRYKIKTGKNKGGWRYKRITVQMPSRKMPGFSIKARPYLRPAIERVFSNNDNIKIALDEIDKAIRKADFDTGRW